MVGALLNEVERTFAVDARRVYLTGLSNGGTGAFHFAARWPDRFAAAVEAMGAGVFQAGVDERDRPAPGNTATLPLLFLHGERDRTIAPETTRRTVAMLGPRRAPADTHFFPDRAHEITLGRGDDGLTLAFFTRQVRTAPPRYVRLETRDAAAARQYWVEVLEGESPSPAAAGSDEARRALAAMMRGPPMSVEGEIGPANEIRLTTKGVRRLRLLLRRDVLTAAGPVRVLLNGRERFAGPLPPDCAARARSLNRSPDPFQAYDAELELSPAGAR
jgi:dienelactone hydrolase